MPVAVSPGGVRSENPLVVRLVVPRRLLPPLLLVPPMRAHRIVVTVVSIRTGSVLSRFRVTPASRVSTLTLGVGIGIVPLCPRVLLRGRVLNLIDIVEEPVDLRLIPPPWLVFG